MTTKVYRTAQGRTVDIGSIIGQNETIRAVGNMGVNARGDKINSDNKTISSRNQQAYKQYRKQTKTSNVSDDPVYTCQAHAQQAQAAQETSINETENFTGSIDSLAAAITKARQSK